MPSPDKRTVARMVAPVLIVLITGLFAILTLPPAHAATTRFGYKKVYEKADYLSAYTDYGATIYHVDTDHADPNGFWFAREGLTPRGIQWVYQPYGMWCTGSAATVQYDPWMNTSGCAPDATLAEADSPGYTANQDACRASAGQPWKTPTQGGSTYSCTNDLLDRRAFAEVNNVEPSTAYACAPWEPQGVDAQGVPACVSTTYPWMTHPDVWYPAPDTCTSMPADSNAGGVYRNPGDYVPSTGDGTCTGNDNAPNCTPGNNAQACTSVPESAPPTPPTTTQFTGTTTTTATASATGSGQATRSASMKVLRGTMRAKVTKRFHGHTYTGRGTSGYYTTGTATRTASGTATVSRTATVTRTCSTATTQADADACAQNSATQDAQAQASTLAQIAANTAAQANAATTAQSQAAQAATADANAVPVTLTMKRTAKAHAVRIAKRDLARKIRNAS